jgi:hypothetical protein
MKILIFEIEDFRNPPATYREATGTALPCQSADERDAGLIAIIDRDKDVFWVMKNVTGRTGAMPRMDFFLEALPNAMNFRRQP